jgi:hypothetical protein
MADEMVRPGIHHLVIGVDGYIHGEETPKIKDGVPAQSRAQNEKTAGDDG